MKSRARGLPACKEDVEHLRMLARRKLSLEYKMEDMAANLPDVKRFVAYQRAYDSYSKTFREKAQMLAWRACGDEEPNAGTEE